MATICHQFQQINLKNFYLLDKEKQWNKLKCLITFVV